MKSMAEKYLVGGVNSPARSFVGVDSEPILVKKGKGPYLWDTKGKKYIDYCMSWGALIAGHSPGFLTTTLKDTITKGTTFGLTSPLEIKLAEMITQAMPAVEKIRFTSSGTEAVMTALRLARAFTRKEKIVRFAGSYHGHVDALLTCEGVPKKMQDSTIIVPYNNAGAIENILTQRSDIAAVIVEPVAANMGVVLPQEGFLKQLRSLTLRHNILLIFDEVITGFRVGYGGAQGLFSVKPDLTCLGKIIGGGLPAGAVGGKKEIMDLLAPVGNVFQAGTFSGNPVTMQAGISTLKFLKKAYYKTLEKNTKFLCDNIKAVALERGIFLQVNYIASMFSLYFTPKQVVDFQTVQTQNRSEFIKLYKGLIKSDILFSPSPLEAQFLSTAHSKTDSMKTIEVVRKIFQNW